MSILLDIVQKLQDTQDAVRKARGVAARYPADRAVLVNLESLERRALSLEQTFLAEAHTDQLDVCTYRMFAEDRHTYPILAVGSALGDLQRWFSTVYDALRNGPKVRAKLAPEILQQSTLNFAFAFTGSVGVAMTVPSERMLVDNDLERAMRKTIEMGRAESSDQIHYFAREVGPASVRAMYRWVSDHTDSGTGADIRWLRDQSEVVSALFEPRHLANLGRAIEETSDTEETTLELVGDLVGADIHRHTFHLVFEDADEIRGTMAESIGIEYTVELPRRYRAVLRKSSFVNYATEEEFIKYHLLELHQGQGG
jgi:hypothetical protein